MTDSVSSSFIKCLNRRVSSASADLNVLDSMTFGTVSFEELLGNCNEVYKKNQSDLVLLQDRLQSFGYHIPGNSRSFPVFSLATEKEICQNWNCLVFVILFKALWALILLFLCFPSFLGLRSWDWWRRRRVSRFINTERFGIEGWIGSAIFLLWIRLFDRFYYEEFGRRFFVSLCQTSLFSPSMF